MRDLLRSVFRGLASLKLAVVLIAVLAAALAWATFLEAQQGREHVQWFVYGSPWFIGLLGLLAANILAAALIRYPWRGSQIGFLVTHAGLLVLLFGAVQTFVGGVEGRLTLFEGETADHMVVLDRSRIKSRWSGKPGAPSGAFVFRGGPVDWPEGSHLDLGEVGGVRLKVLKFYRHARRAWKPAAEGQMPVPQLTFQPVDVPGNRTSGPEAAALVEVSAGGVTQQVWLGRDQRDLSFYRLHTPEGTVELSFGYDSLPMGFSLTLLDTEEGVYPGAPGRAASYSSTVHLVDPRREIDQQHVISMNEPLVYDGYRFYQTGYNKIPISPDDPSQAAVPPDQKAKFMELSTLTVAHDPGRAMKYAGSLMICLGCLLMFLRRRARPAAGMLGLFSIRRNAGRNGDPQPGGDRRSLQAAGRTAGRPPAPSRAKAG